ncbi:riboflavin synthase alpha chain [Flagellimonas taeanensis]|jgi:riboflavin synthase|uniref:Riboflavin synthase n=1 Tax=Flagellimonas taeanensis TaxID=1005926 RepID=A0A1M6Q6A4_9FLAO|nr:riboflavin synthase [Allomuricauda taeanensis]MEE1961539.1 riboflavin synthase [Allomuricauda taeanensis]SFB69293.1 riboflavin synthase alpha chain [Allomuricauda taeanensis]SHK15794.1 riboflavin synthase alpha chain [Allomuricauda taeanensis]
MFTGIIETLGKVEKLEKEGGNLHLTISSDITSELKIDQSVSHNGVCLTVVSLNDDQYTVTAIEETLNKTNLEELTLENEVNLERAMVLGARLDGHIVQGHVDQTAVCTSIDQKDGSWVFTFQYDPKLNNVTIEKGSITVDGVSLTVVDSEKDHFSVAIIPYTYEHTRFHTYKVGTTVNLEFDVVGKYVARLLELRN